MREGHLQPGKAHLGRGNASVVTGEVEQVREGQTTSLDFIVTAKGSQ